MQRSIYAIPNIPKKITGIFNGNIKLNLSVNRLHCTRYTSKQSPPIAAINHPVFDPHNKIVKPEIKKNSTSPIAPPVARKDIFHTTVPYSCW